jgi:diaminohydroxyphosphoribosylaminopyrimidine deaminase / 5-amino-6-(5-phosphoribosylamino)uracil reductase
MPKLASRMEAAPGASRRPQGDMTGPADADSAFMAHALALALRGLDTATPNPRVGCVLVKDGELIGEGFHARAGEAHAEINALIDAKARGHDTRGATAYVTLEPCNHTGRTPPCTEALISARVIRVVVAMPDPNPQAGRGASRLRDAGLAVEIGLREDEARELNLGFISRMTRGRPWVRMKVASSLDGRTALASGESQWITSDAAREDGHRFRARACAVMTGIGTIRQDDPRLTARGVGSTRQPLVVIIDRHGDTPAGARALASGNALIVTARATHAVWPRGVATVELPDANGRVDLAATMRELGTRGINELHVEAGEGLNGALLAAGVVDELLLFLAPCVIGDPARGVAAFPGGLARLADRVPLRLHDVARIGNDLRVQARVARKES